MDEESEEKKRKRREFDAMLAKSRWASEFLREWKRAHAIVLGLVVGGVAEHDRAAVIVRLRRAEADPKLDEYTRQLIRAVLPEIEREPPVDPHEFLP